MKKKTITSPTLEATWCTFLNIVINYHAFYEISNEKYSVFGVMIERKHISCFSHAQYISLKFSGTKKKTPNDTFRDGVHRIYQAIFLLPKALQFQGTCAHDSKYANKNYDFSPSIFTKLTSIQQLRVSTISSNKYGKHGQIHYAPKNNFHCANFHGTHHHSINFCAHLQYQLSYKSDKKRKKYGQNIIYALKV